MKAVATRTIALVIAIAVVVAAAAAIYFAMRPAPPPAPEVAPAGCPLHEAFLYIVVNDEMTRIHMYKTDVVDIATITPARWKDLNGTRIGDFVLLLEPDLTKPRFTIQYALFNTMREPFNIPEMRQALSWVIPYETVLGTIFGGLSFAEY